VNSSVVACTFQASRGRRSVKPRAPLASRGFYFVVLFGAWQTKFAASFMSPVPL
jgi:hypothetical protein